MVANKIIRLASEEDGNALLEIYGPYIQNTAVTFEYEVPTIQEFSKRIGHVSEKLPWLVCEIDGKAVGYAYASKHRERAAYQWSVDVAIYVHPEHHRKGIANALYSALLQFLKTLGYYNAYAGIGLPNPKSEGFHEFFGFQPVGVYHHAGYKLDAWHDVKWYGLTLAEYPSKPEFPKSIHEIKDTKEFKEVLENAIHLIK